MSENVGRNETQLLLGKKSTWIIYLNID